MDGDAGSMNIEVEVSLDTVSAAVAHVVKEAFARPRRSNHTGGWAYESARKAVAEYLRDFDWEPVVRAAVEGSLHEVVAEVVEKEIARHAKAEAKLRLAGGRG